MRLDRLLGGVDAVAVRGDPAAVEVAGVAYDSRRVTSGSLFCCLRGAVTDGHEFAADAVAAGAAALLCERPLPLDVAQVVVGDARAAMAAVADAFYDHPSAALSVVGVTGTNGKTTTTHLAGAALTRAGFRCAVLGTLSGTRTTPESPDLQAALAGFRHDGMAAVAMEVSSHALALRRVDATRFAVAVFTNLSHDHLDFHASIDDYFQAKAMLFDPERASAAVVNADDPYGRVLLDTARVPTRPFSLTDAQDLDVSLAGSTFRWRGHAVRLHLGGTDNVANALAAATAAVEIGADAAAVAAGLSDVKTVRGRVEPVDAGQPFTVLIDYAHTPEALEHVARAAHADAAARGGRAIVVFGCGGDRDRAKRPEMGEVATRLADVVVLTSDNPRHEDPMAIIDDVRAGVVRDDVLRVVPDRREAIATAIATAQPGDVVVIAGKGHETTQVIGDEAVPFDDREVAVEELASWR